MNGCNFYILVITYLVFSLNSIYGRRRPDGRWGDWGPWEGCTASCGTGISTRTANWIMNGIKTQYLFHDIMECSAAVKCPEDGHWGVWMMWEACPVMCGGGVHKRHRKCDSPEPTYGGRDCTGDSSEKRLCNNQTCPAVPKDFDPSFCLTDVFICKSAKFCVARKQTCDGVLHCDDGSDEIDCATVSNFKQLDNSGCSMTKNTASRSIQLLLAWLAVIYLKY